MSEKEIFKKHLETNKKNFLAVENVFAWLDWTQKADVQQTPTHHPTQLPYFFTALYQQKTTVLCVPVCPE